MLGLTDVVGRVVVNEKTGNRGCILEGSEGVYAKNRTRWTQSMPARRGLQFEARDYQEELVNGIKQSMIAGNHSIIVQSPPRSGKTVVMAHIAKGATDKNNKVLFFSHRKEINEQVYKDVRK